MSPSKYGAEATTVDGVRFASKKEATRYLSLRLLERVGEITDLVLQPRYPLHVCSWLDEGDGVRIGHYVGDFAYRDIKTGRAVIEDVKGFRTPLYRWKKKHVEAQYGITIREV